MASNSKVEEFNTDGQKKKKHRRVKKIIKDEKSDEKPAEDEPEANSDANSKFGMAETPGPGVELSNSNSQKELPAVVNEKSLNASQKEMSNSGPAVDLAPKDCFAGIESFGNDSFGQFNFEKLDIAVPGV